MIKDLNGALSLLTVLPTSGPFPEKPGRAFAMFPLVGVLIGATLWSLQTIALRLVDADIAAFVVLAAWVFITGGLHLDGFGDACDGLFATVPVARRLEIMKDPRTGAWAVIGLVLLLLGKWLALRNTTMIVLAATLSRWVMVVAVAAYPYARQQGMGEYYKEGLGRGEVITATLTMLAVLALHWQRIHAVGLVLIVVFVVAHWAKGRLGGLTGDVYGALCELTELLVLLFV